MNNNQINRAQPANNIPAQNNLINQPAQDEQQLPEAAANLAADLVANAGNQLVPNAGVANPVVANAGEWDTENPQVAPRSIFLPDCVIKAKVDKAQLGTVLRRLQSFFRTNSIQATYTNGSVTDNTTITARPRSLDISPNRSATTTTTMVKLQTLGLVECVVKFWKGEGDNEVLVDIQKQRGDNYKYHHLMHDIRQVVQGPQEPQELLASNKRAREEPMSVEELLAINRSVAMLPVYPMQEVTDHTERVVNLLHSNLTSGSFSLRASAIESLLQGTSLLCTVERHALEMAETVLTGRAPEANDPQLQDELNTKCQEIHDVLVHVLLNREFEGDDEWKNGFSHEFEEPQVGPTGISPFKKSRVEFNRQYESVMSRNVNKILGVFDNSLQTISSDRDNPQINREIVLSFYNNDKFIQEDGSNKLVSTLVGLMEEANQSMALAYRACRVLSGLCELSTEVNDEVRNNPQVRACVENQLAIAAEQNDGIDMERTRLFNLIA